MSPAFRSALLLVLLPAIGGCPTGNREHGHSGLPPCSKFGDNCEFSPGKLGSCVVKDGCTSASPADCFVCQSQH